MENSLVRRLIAKPELGPLILLIVEIAVFGSINDDFLSPLNISNTLAFTVELGLIALAMTLLMTSGEFDLSVGSLFGFSPVLMWTLRNSSATSLEVAFVISMLVAAFVALNWSEFLRPTPLSLGLGVVDAPLGGSPEDARDGRQRERERIRIGDRAEPAVEDVMAAVGDESMAVRLRPQPQFALATRPSGSGGNVAPNGFQSERRHLHRQRKAAQPRAGDVDPDAAPASE